MRNEEDKMNIGILGPLLLIVVMLGPLLLIVVMPGVQQKRLCLSIVLCKVFNESKQVRGQGQCTNTLHSLTASRDLVAADMLQRWHLFPNGVFQRHSQLSYIRKHDVKLSCVVFEVVVYQVNNGHKRRAVFLVARVQLKMSSTVRHTDAHDNVSCLQRKSKQVKRVAAVPHDK